MPVYGTTTQTLEAGRPAIVWEDEDVSPSGSPDESSSVAVGLRRHATMPNVFSAEVQFAANPGAFAVALQVADTDDEEFYVTKATLNTGLNTAFVGRIEVTNSVAKFARLKMVTRTNAVNVTAKFF